MSDDETSEQRRLLTQRGTQLVNAVASGLRRAGMIVRMEGQKIAQVDSVDLNLHCYVCGRGDTFSPLELQMFYRGVRAVTRKMPKDGFNTEKVLASVIRDVKAKKVVQAEWDANWDRQRKNEATCKTLASRAKLPKDSDLTSNDGLVFALELHGLTESQVIAVGKALEVVP